MNLKHKNTFIALGIAVFFSLLLIVGAFDRLGYQVYDVFLRFRAAQDRPHTGYVVFLNVDDNAIAHNGVFPWPRSITADALLRLKEFGAKAVIFDIEYIDRGPPGVDIIYLTQGLPADFSRSFSEINAVLVEISSALGYGRILPQDANEYFRQLQEIINNERDILFSRAQRIARDNDQYLIDASALFGRSWVTLNLRPDPLTDEEWISRRPMAEELFSYPVIASARAVRGSYVDVLSTIPGFAQAAKGAGYTNIVIDLDGTRRRIYLAQNINDHWYLQLVLPPLMEYFGNPEIELCNRRMIIRGAAMPDGIVRDISIPLDGRGRMLLDWPRTDYFDTFEHLSFQHFSLLEDMEAELEYHSRALGTVDFFFFAGLDESLIWLPFILADLEALFDAVHAARETALKESCENSFFAFVEYRSQSRELIRELLEIDPAARVSDLLSDLLDRFPEHEEFFLKEAAYIESLTNALAINLLRYEEERERIENMVRGRFSIIGRVDTGTTDIGTTPFFGKYVNVGTHGIVLDMILSGVFITPVGVLWQALFAIVFVLLFFLASERLAPVPRAVSGFLTAFLIAAAFAVLFRLTGIYFNPLAAVFALVTAVIVREIISYASSEQEKQFIRKAFSTYVSDEVVKEILADPSRLQLGGTKRHMTALFTDIKGFTEISEQLDPESLVKLLNRYLTFMSDAIFEQMGTIDKYIGDAIVAFYGAPVELPDHALRACNTALAIKRGEAILNKRILKENLSTLPLLTRIGINTGDMVAGNMGTDNKMNYTIMGNTVNLAARLEGVNKQYDTWILTSENTVKETGGTILVRKVDRVRVVGIDKPVRLYELIETMSLATPEQKKMVEIFHEALDYYESKKWKEAAQGFEESLSLEKEGPSAVYLKRCQKFMASPPAENWDGVYSLTQK